MKQQQDQNPVSKSTENISQPTTSTGADEVKKMNVNPNPRANENISNEDADDNSSTTGVGSEITDGESS